MPKVLEKAFSVVSIKYDKDYYFANSYLHFLTENHLAKAGYAVVSNDKTGSRDKSITLMTKMLQGGRSVVVDNVRISKLNERINIHKKNCFISYVSDTR